MMIDADAVVSPHNSHRKRRHILLFTFYLSTGITTALLLIMFGVWTDWYWWSVVCFVPLFGSLLLIVAAFFSLYWPQTAARLGILATILAWLGWGPFVFGIGIELVGHLLDRNFTTIVRIQEDLLWITQNSLDGRDRSSVGFPISILMPILLLASATIYSIWASWRNRAG